MRYMVIPQLRVYSAKHIPVMFCIIDKYTKEEIIMFKFLAKVAEKYAKATNTACMMMWVIHQPKMPASLIKKD